MRELFRPFRGLIKTTDVILSVAGLLLLWVFTSLLCAVFG